MNDRFELKRNTSCIDVVQKRVFLEKALPKIKMPLMHTAHTKLYNDYRARNK